MFLKLKEKLISRNMKKKLYEDVKKKLKRKVKFNFIGWNEIK